MKEEIIYKTALLILLFGYTLARLPFAKKCKKCTKIKDMTLNFEKFKVFVAWLGMCFFPFIYIFSSALNSFRMDLSPILRIMGVAGLAFNIVFFYYIHKQLDKNWSPVLEIKEGHELITNGIYEYIRHPMYTQCWIWVILQVFVTSNWFVGLFGIVSWAFLYFTRVGNEEKLMTAQFGDKYTEYMARTGRLLPKF